MFEILFVENGYKTTFCALSLVKKAGVTLIIFENVVTKPKQKSAASFKHCVCHTSSD